jgi:hypothetical protein
MEENPYRSPVEFQAPKQEHAPPSKEQYHVVFIAFGALGCLVFPMMFPPTGWSLMTIVKPPWPLCSACGFFVMALGSATHRPWVFRLGTAAIAVAVARILIA